MEILNQRTLEWILVGPREMVLLERSQDAAGEKDVYSRLSAGIRRSIINIPVGN
jgi:hypothetical protein